MVRRVDVWVAEDGTKFDTQMEALRHEVFLILRPMLENDALAGKVVSGLTPEVQLSLRNTLSEMIDANG